MTKDAPAFDFYPERFWFAVEGWTDAEICRYWRLLSQQWMRDGLPQNVKELEGMARGKLTERVLAKFPAASDGKRRNPFLEQLRSEQRQRIQKAKEKSEKMHAARYGRPSAERAASPAASAAASSPQALLKPCPPPTTHHSPHTSVDKSPDVEGRTQKRAAPPPVDDETWIAELEKTTAYQGISIRSELGKMQQWCQVNGRQPSRRRFVNWLNNARPMQVHSPRPQARHAAYNAETHTAGMTGKDIGEFCPDQK